MMNRMCMGQARRTLRHLAKTRRGSVYFETAMAVLLMFVFILGVTRVMLYSNDIGNAERTLRSASDLAWMIEDERPNSLSQAQVDDMFHSLRKVYGKHADDRLEIIISYYDANDAGTHFLTYSGSSGDLSEPTRATVSSGEVSLGAHSYVLADDERLLVVELFVRGRGLQRDRIDYYSTALLRGGAAGL